MADPKHLEFLQAAIARMAANSFLAKGWSITLTTAILGLAATEDDAGLVLIALLPILLFAVIDAYYLALERGFRVRFAAAAETYANDGKPDFQMSPGWSWAQLLRAIRSPAVYLVHGPLAATLTAAFLVLRCR